jgi:hypothetical protein
MRHTRQFPCEVERVETGPIKFGDDWAGIFIRGTNALHYAAMLEWVAKQAEDPLQRESVKELRELLLSCDERF